MMRLFSHIYHAIIGRSEPFSSIDGRCAEPLADGDPTVPSSAAEDLYHRRRVKIPEELIQDYFCLLAKRHLEDAARF